MKKVIHLAFSLFIAFAYFSFGSSVTPASAHVPTPTPVCHVRFTQTDRVECSVYPVTVTAYAIVDEAPTGASLQLSSYIVNPLDKATTQEYFSFSPIVVGQSYPVSVLWPGRRDTDTLVEVHFGAQVLNAQGNPFGCTGSLDYFWIPSAQCTPTVTPTPTQPPTVPEFGLVSGVATLVASAATFKLFKKRG